MNLFYQANIAEGINQLDEEESKHVQRVLRLSIGDTIYLTDGKGSLYEAQLTQTKAKNTLFNVVNKIFFSPPHYSIHIAIAPTKNADRMEWFVEKAVELGIQQISFILCDNSERRTINIERIEKKAISAMKQSGQYWLPSINPIKPFKQFVETAKGNEHFIGFVDDQHPTHLQTAATPGKVYVVLIGPEGDFSKNELAFALEQNMKKISLGTTRLRTETAGIAACHILNLVNR
jgi:16S rRNA (uracil1498-N3)-methyltransferase